MKKKCVSCKASIFSATVTKSSRTEIALEIDDPELGRHHVNYRDDEDDLEVDITEIKCIQCGEVLPEAEWDIDDDDVNQGKFLVRLK